MSQFRRDRCGHRKRGSIKRPGRHGVTRSVPPAGTQRVHARGENRGGALQSLVLVFGGPLLGDPDRQPRSATGSPTGVAARVASASQTTRPPQHFGKNPTRSRCVPSIANCPAGVFGEPSPPVGNAGEAPAPIPVLAADLGDIALNDTSDHGDV